MMLEAVLSIAVAGTGYLACLAWGSRLDLITPLVSMTVERRAAICLPNTSQTHS